MNVPNMSPAEFMSQTPDQLFLFLTNYIYEARRDGRLDDVAAILSVFDDIPEAQRALLIGSSTLLAMAPGPYRDAIKKALAKTLYQEMKGGRKPCQNC